jgi:hypothetical protein
MPQVAPDGHFWFKGTDYQLKDVIGLKSTVSPLSDVREVKEKSFPTVGQDRVKEHSFPSSGCIRVKVKVRAHQPFRSNSGFTFGR